MVGRYRRVPACPLEGNSYAQEWISLTSFLPNILKHLGVNSFVLFAGLVSCVLTFIFIDSTNFNTLICSKNKLFQVFYQLHFSTLQPLFWGLYCKFSWSSVGLRTAYFQPWFTILSNISLQWDLYPSFHWDTYS